MANTRTYVGGTGDWSVAANWSGAAVPVTTDTVIIPSNTAVNITAGLDQGGVDLAAMIIAKGSVVEIGATGNPLKISASLVHHMGRGGFYFEHAQDAGSAFKTDLVLIEPSLPTAIVQLGSEETDALGMPDVLINSGRVTIKANMGTMTTLDVRHRTNRGSDVNLTIEPAAGTLTTLYGAAGIIEAHNLITNAVLSNGCQLTKETDLVTNAYIGSGAAMFYNDDGTIVIARVYESGILDLTHVGKEVTITTGIWNPGSIIRLNDTLHTVTTTYDLRGV